MTPLKPILTVDVVLLTLVQGRLHVALMPRDKAPYQGHWALVGGYVHVDEDTDSASAALRTLKGKLHFEPRHLEQVCTQANATRDPRGWSASIVYLALQPVEVLTPLTDQAGLQLFDVSGGVAGLPDNLAFDHAELISLAIARLQAKAAYSTLVAYFLPDVFTIPELQKAYESVLGQKMNAANFRRKILESAQFQLAGMAHSTGRPAQAYRLVPYLETFTRALV